MARNWPGLCGSTVTSLRNSASRQLMRHTCENDRKNLCSGVKPSMLKHRHHLEQLVHCPGALDSPEFGLNRPESKLLNPIGVHRRSVKIAHLLRRRILLHSSMGCPLEDFVNQIPIPFLQFTESSPPRFIRRHRIILNPRPIRVPEKIRRRVHRFIHVLDRKPRHAGWRVGRAGGMRAKRKNDCGPTRETVRNFHLVSADSTTLNTEDEGKRNKPTPAGRRSATVLGTVLGRSNAGKRIALPHSEISESASLAATEDGTEDGRAPVIRCRCH